MQLRPISGDVCGCWGAAVCLVTTGWSEGEWYVTDRSKAIVVTAGSQIVLVSPKDRDGFLAEIEHAGAQTLAPSAESTSGGPHFTLTISAARGLALPTSFVLAIVVGIPAFVVALVFLYAPGRPPVDLTRDSLVIHSRFYGMTVPASSVDAADVRVVDLRTEPGWKPVLRTNGFGNLHYLAGNFLTASGRAVKLFTTGTERLVLLPPSSAYETPVLLDVADPDQFAARVRQEWRGK